jgi:flagellar FliJ protein
MPEHKSIRLALELATRQRDALAKAHAHALRNLSFAKDQMANLENYASDTDTRWMGTSNTAIAPEILRHHVQFTGRLQEAIGMQTGVIDKLTTQVTAAHQALLQAEFRLSGLNQVLQNRQAVVQLRKKRAEQRETDEFAALRHLHARVALMHGEHDDPRS